ncbi:Hypothetical protein LUCI_1238 [Lucifera butyrica]|uniref:Uncharacterized protein n=1 Tax=Lucifera butyrica TaxID=1351585 RepID=A0A498R5C6_9FIRM|nr:hypothetical protein [Lucifera butyrica]VBB06027.1 Hypothetical protein LUCI_1238 [Lucifera butyrica]
MITCPVCGQRTVGKVGADQYFCWDCCVEFIMSGQSFKVFDVELDGTLTLHDDPMQNAVNLEVQKG